MIRVSKIRKLSKTKLYIFIAIVAAILVVGLWLSGLNTKRIDIGRSGGANMPIGSLMGEDCENGGARPYAVMLASDPVTRPLSGIAHADIVIEMPVTPGGITRLMALYQCETPESMGSIRSARSPFLSLAAGFSSIYAHWGGEKGALQKLNAGILDNIDALKDPHNAFFRLSSVSPPHNGFTNYERLKNAADKFGYEPKDSFRGYPRGAIKEKNLSQLAEEIKVDYNGPYSVLWQYDSLTKNYKRFRAGLPEKDKIGESQVEVKNIIIIGTSSKFLNEQYIDLVVEGRGAARLYRDGIAKGIFWEKKGFDGKLLFLDGDGEEIELAPGKIWIHYITK